MNILGKRYFFFGLSLLVILPGLIIIAIWGLPFSIDFTGGSRLEIKFASGTAPLPADVVQLYDQAGYSNTQVQTIGTDTLQIRAVFMEEDARLQMIDQIEKKFNDQVTVQSFESVGPTIGKEVASRAFFAVAIAALGVIIYITLAFRGLPHAFRYGVCAIVAMLHDILVVVSVTAIGSKLFGWQVDSLFLTAFLTVIGFSVQDKIVVFDRIRENSGIYRKLPYETLANHSIIQTLQRSINTQLMTSEFLLLSMALIGGVTLQQFSIVLLIGLACGTYSSIFIAAPVLVVWENQEWKTWFKGKNGTQLA